MIWAEEPTVDELIGGKGKVRMVVVRESSASWGSVSRGEVEQVEQLDREWKSPKGASEGREDSEGQRGVGAGFRFERMLSEESEDVRDERLMRASR